MVQISAKRVSIIWKNMKHFITRPATQALQCLPVYAARYRGGKVYLYSQYSQYSETGGEVLILKKLDDRYVIESHLTHRDFLDSDAVENMFKQKNAA